MTWLSNFSLVRLFGLYRAQRQLNVERGEAFKRAFWVVFL